MWVRALVTQVRQCYDYVYITCTHVHDDTHTHTHTYIRYPRFTNTDETSRFCNRDISVSHVEDFRNCYTYADIGICAHIQTHQQTHPRMQAYIPILVMPIFAFFAYISTDLIQNKTDAEIKIHSQIHASASYISKHASTQARGVAADQLLPVFHEREDDM